MDAIHVAYRTSFKCKTTNKPNIKSFFGAIKKNTKKNILRLDDILKKIKKYHCLLELHINVTCKI